ncbi:MAG TPA: AAA family ATPase [Actinomycetota bacterium]|nr:AAA family ATPase [Actinomycetota bacterium]
MKVSVAGKGGSGKTTCSGTLSRLLGRTGGPVLAVDADSNPNLAVTLGLGRAGFDSVTPLPHGLMEHRRVNGEVTLSLSRPLEDLLDAYGVSCPDDVTLLQLGAPSGAGKG